MNRHQLTFHQIVERIAFRPELYIRLDNAIQRLDFLLWQASRDGRFCQERGPERRHVLIKLDLILMQVQNVEEGALP